MEFLELDVEGLLSTKRQPWDAFDEVLKRSQEIVALGSLRLLCGFEEAGSKQTKRAYDIVGFRVSRGRVSFEYFANGSKVMLGGPYAREFVSRVILRLHLPLELRGTDSEFTVAHTSSGGLWLTGTLGTTSWNPTGFVCELPTSSMFDALRKVREFLDAFATSKRFLHSWSTGRERGGQATVDTALSLRIYEAVVAARLRAERYEVRADFRLKDVTGIEALRHMCGPNDVVYTRLCSFELPEDNWGELTIETGAAGHRLNLALRIEEGLRLVEKRLGLSFHSA